MSQILEKELYTEESFRDSLATVDEKGNRKWVFPKRPSGRYYQARVWVSYILLLLLFGGPFLSINGEPLLLFNFFERKFVLFGQVFWPQDFHLFVIGMITLLVFIILFTVVYGRLFCGWVCPQTIFMEMVFRRIEYLIEGDYMAQKNLKNSPWTWQKIVKRTSKEGIFLIISFLIMHTFIAYLIGIEELWAIVRSSPADQPVGFISMLFFTGAFYFIFSRFREQVCTTVCPYGRLQGVLLDKNSVVVAYDYQRGEGREKFRKGEDRKKAGKGDCIDCKLCVAVCPTGIDIRNGTQLECVSCTACIDACDSIMDRVDLPRGLIRYASETSISAGVKFSFTGRMKAYTAVLMGLIGVFIALLIIRSDVETTIMRTPGILYQEREDGQVSNLYAFKVINKTNKDFPLEFRIIEGSATIQQVGESVHVEEQGVAEGAFFILAEPAELKGRKTVFSVGVYSGSELIETVKTTFLGPNL